MVSSLQISHQVNCYLQVGNISTPKCFGKSLSALKSCFQLFIDNLLHPSSLASTFTITESSYKLQANGQSLFITYFCQKIIPFLTCLLTVTWKIPWTIWLCIWHSETTSVTEANRRTFLSCLLFFWDSFLQESRCKYIFSFTSHLLKMPNSILHLGCSLLWGKRNLYKSLGVKCPFYRVYTPLDS